MTEQQPWGIDAILSSVLDEQLSKPIDNMNIDEIREVLQRYDWELSALEEEVDLHGAVTNYGGLKSERERQNEEANRRKEAIAQPQGVYYHLVQRFAALAETDIDRRAVDLRARQALSNAITSSETFRCMQKATGDAYRVWNKEIEGVGRITMRNIFPLLQTETDHQRRKVIYLAARNLGGIEEKLGEQIEAVNGSVTEISPRFELNFRTPFELEAHVYEAPSPSEIIALLRRFVDETKPVYNELFSKLVTAETIKPWDIEFLMTQKDPFKTLEVPQDPVTLFECAVRFLKDLGYHPQVVDELYNPQNPNVYIDIEARDGKKPGAMTCSLGPFSKGKGILYYEPTVFSGNARKRWGTFPHEMGHGLHYHFTRRCVDQGAIFFWEPTPTTETFSMLHEGIAVSFDVLKKYLPVDPSQERYFEMWNLLRTLNIIYSIARVSATEWALHTEGVHKARETFVEMERLTLPKQVENGIHPSSAYASVPHVHQMPGYYWSYGIAELNRMAIMTEIQRRQRSNPRLNIAEFVTNELMTGNAIPLSERIRRVTGVTNIAENAVCYVRDEHARLTQ